MAGAALLGLAGCNRQDTDCLSRLGHKLLERTQTATQEVRAKLDLGGKASELGLQERVQQRLQGDKALTESAIEVTVQDHEVELKGTVKTPEQRQRALDLAESTVGVNKLNDVLKIEP